MNNSKQSLIERFFVTTIKIRRVIDQMSNVSIEDKVATMLQMQALTYLKDRPKITVGELGSELHMSSSAIAQLTDRLVNSKFVIRETDDLDRRIVRLELTKDGKKELIKIHTKMLKKINKFASYISSEDLETIVNVQSRVLKNLEDKKTI